MGKIKIEFEEKKFLFVKYTDIWVKVSWIEYILLSFFFVFFFLEMPFLLHDDDDDDTFIKVSKL